MSKRQVYRQCGECGSTFTKRELLNSYNVLCRSQGKKPGLVSRASHVPFCPDCLHDWW